MTSHPTPPPEEEREVPQNFITSQIDRDLEAGLHDRVVTRFPPEPSGSLHIGHAKALCVNFGIAADYGGQCHLRFDDTNPLKESDEFVRAIERDIEWLGFDWGPHLYFASDYFERFYEWAEQLVVAGRAYVDSQSVEAIRAGRGRLGHPGVESPYRARSVAENLDLLRRMRAGEFAEGAHVLRAKIDMASPNMVMRDPLLYRIKHAAHHRQGEAWCIYPMYDYAHCLEDYIEGVTHSLCSLEFETRRELYDWILEALELERPRPHQYEFARLAIDYTVTSKRHIARLADGRHVRGWDDPRLLTLAGLRARGVTPSAIRAFCRDAGVSKANSTIDIAQLDRAIRDDLNDRAPRRMVVMDPLEVEITNWPADKFETIKAPEWPEDIDREGARPIEMGRKIFVERDDWRDDPPKGYYRLSLGREVRLRHGYYITVTEAVRDKAGRVVSLKARYAEDSKGGSTPDGRRVRGTIHWVAAHAARPATIHLFDRLFEVADPLAGDDPDPTRFLNPDSLRVVEALAEPSLASVEPGERFQFERQGYFYVPEERDPSGPLLFYRTVALKDTWGRRRDQPEPAQSAPETAEPSRPEQEAAPAKARDEARRALRATDPELQAAYERFLDPSIGLDPDDADILAGDRELAAFFEAAIAQGAPAQPVANWVVNEVLAEAKGRALSELAFGPAEIGRMVSLLEADTISSQGAKRVFATLAERGGDPDQIVRDQDLEQIRDPDAIARMASEVVAAHPEQLEAWRGGKKKLVGFFIGKLMARTKGRVDPSAGRSAIVAALSDQK